VIAAGHNLDSFQSRRSVAFGTAGMVASNQPAATAAGVEVLRSGGSAADAALAVAAALHVLEPYSTGLGGDAFWMYYDASRDAVSAVNGSGRSPSALTLQRAAEAARGEVRIPELHPYGVTVPGAPAAWQALHDRFGRLPRREVLKRAVTLADHGFPVAPMTAHLWRKHGQTVLGRTSHGKELLVRDGVGPAAGEIVKLPLLADSLAAFAEEGAEPFYRGRIARSIVRAVQREGGILTEGDLAACTVEEVEPLGTKFRGRTVWELPPNGQGLVALVALAILEELGTSRDPAETVHRQIEATRIAFALANRYVGDPAFEEVPVTELLGAFRVAQWAGMIGTSRTDLSGIGLAESPGSGSDTVYFCTADRDGNVCSFINSIFTAFGSGIVPEGTGFALQNRARGFVLTPGHPNAAAPAKRPYHTIIPGMYRDAEEGITAFGVMGGYMQPQGHVQVLPALFDDGLDPQSALDRPRYYLEDGAPDGRVLLEDAFDPSLVNELRRRGHDLSVVSGRDRTVFGLGQIISRRGPVWAGGSDPRGDGVALGV
jgi:gamma-glutamyltranspeptidase / glutathione hydrolase